MMNRIKNLLYFLLTTSLVLPAYAQQAEKTENVEHLLSAMAPEEAFVHYNSTLLFAGEYLYYKLYIMNQASGTTTENSKIGYVELVGPQNKVVFRHKLRLESGLGAGDFFIPVTVPSGSYKLLGYTNWMLNGGASPGFQGDLIIVNPYQGNQRVFTKENEMTEDSLVTVSPNEEKASQTKEREDREVQLIVEKNTYGKREPINIQLSSTKDTIGYGTYSVSVRRVNEWQAPSAISANEVRLINLGGQYSREGKIVLPDLRGELISGRVLSPSGESFKNQKVSVSIPGENFLFRIVRTDQNGRFFVNLGENFSGTQAILQVLGQQEEGFTIELDNNPLPDYRYLEFQEFYLTPEMEDEILERSISNQIENAYFSVKPDTLVPQQEETPFYGNRMEVYNLDDYTRFRTLKETFVEFIKSARIGKNQDGEEVFVVTSHNPGMQFNLPPLVLVDGVQVQRHADAIRIEAPKIQSIGIVRDKYFLGAEVFQGIVQIETIDGNFDVTRDLEQSVVKELLPHQPKKRYFQPNYEEEASSLDRIPDLRRQLLWLPSLSLHSDEVEVAFTTSDIPGNYEISVEGFTRSGEPVSIKKMIRVE